MLPSPNWISGLGLTDASVPWSDTGAVFFSMCCNVYVGSQVRVRGLGLKLAPQWFRNNSLYF